jgi:hypothetical protein
MKRLRVIWGVEKSKRTGRLSLFYAVIQSDPLLGATHQLKRAPGTLRTVSIINGASLATNSLDFLPFGTVECGVGGSDATEQVLLLNFSMK